MIKKNRCFMGIGLLFVWILMTGCASTPKTAITETDLPHLRGTWSGWTTFSSRQSEPVVTTLVISSDTVPIGGRFILHNFPGPVRKAMNIPLENVTADNSITIYFKNAEITGKGTLINRNGQDYLELTYYAGEKQKLEGPFYFFGATGEVTLSKKAGIPAKQ